MMPVNGRGLTNGRSEPNGGGLTDGPGLVNGLAYTGEREGGQEGLVAFFEDEPGGLTLRRDLINGFSIEGKVEWRPRGRGVRRRMKELAEAPMPRERDL